MGYRYQHLCGQCGYQAIVSGDGDAGMYTTTATIVCLDCEELYDVVTSRHQGGADFVGVPVARPKDPEHKVQKWRSGDPCPHFGHPIKRGAGRMIWD